MMKKSISILLAIVMLLSMLPMSVFAQDVQPTYKDMGAPGGTNVMPVDYKAKTSASQDGTTEFASLQPMTASLPSKYSSVSEGRTTAIKDQNPYGTCWAFSATTTSEASLYTNSKSKTTLSPLQLAYFFYNTKVDPLGNASGDSTTPLQNSCLDQGGNHLLTMWALANWTTACKESTLPYNDTNLNKALNGTIDSKYANNYDVAHLQNCYIIPNDGTAANRNNIKAAIQKYGAVAMNYLHNDYYMNYETGAYYFPYDYYGTNHAVTIVGWNDNYPASKFGGINGDEDFPAKDGAWLVQNSWGTWFGTDGDSSPTNSGAAGYMWISYYDGSMMYDGNVFVFDYEKTGTYKYNYQYDGGTSCSDTYVSAGTKTAAIYTVKGKSSDAEKIDAIGVGVSDPDMSGTVYIYANPSSGKPTSGKQVAKTTFTTTYAGYYTIPIPDGPVLEKGETFSVVIEWKTGGWLFTDENYNYGWVAGDINTSKDKTYIINGSTVTNCANNGYTLRLKAYTNEAEGKPWDVKPVVTGSHVAASGCNKLSWKAIDGAVSYNVYRATSKNGTYSKIKNTSNLSFTNTSAEVGKTYYYKVTAVNSKGVESNPSDIKTLIPDLAQPVVTSGTVASTGYPKLTWDAVPGATGYQVYRSTTKDGTYSLTKTTTSTSYTNTTAKAGTTYYYYVVAIMDGNESATSANSAIKTVTCDCAQPVVKVSNVASTGYPKLTWDAVTGATGYQVYRATTKDGTYSLMKTTTSTSYINTSATHGKTYYYYVVAIVDGKSAATSAPSDIKTSTCDLAQPVMTATAGTGKITIKWTAVEGATGYKIYRATSKDGTYSLVRNVTSGDVVTFNNTSVTSGKTYYYKMVAILDGKDAATSAYSEVKSATAK